MLMSPNLNSLKFITQKARIYTEVRTQTEVRTLDTNSFSRVWIQLQGDIELVFSVRFPRVVRVRLWACHVCPVARMMSGTLLRKFGSKAQQDVCLSALGAESFSQKPLVFLSRQLLQRSSSNEDSLEKDFFFVVSGGGL